MDQTPKTDERPRKNILRHSPDRLLRQAVELPGVLVVSAERHKGRIVVRLPGKL